MLKRQIVLTGVTGSGKTTLFNKICKTNQQVKAGGKSLTRQTFLKEAAYGSGFRVLDTPGYNAKEEKIIHAVCILNALSEGPVSQILLIVKWERIELMQDYIKSMVAKFKRYRHLLTVAVTHWDMADRSTLKENQEESTNLCGRFGINSVIFISKFDSGEQICAQIDSILIRCQAEKIQLTEAEFYSNFDLIELKGETELELESQKQEVTVKFRKISCVIKKYIKDFDVNNPSMQEIMHYLALETKQIAENLISDFEQKNNEKFSKLFEYSSNPSLAYLIHFELKKELMEAINEIVKLTQEKMKSDKNHFFNFIKECPHCSLIWLKVSGCEGQTTCGAFPNQDQYFNDFKMPKKYQFTITEKGINYVYNQQFSKQDNKFQQVNQFSNRMWPNNFNIQQSISPIYHEPQNDKRKGCGKPIVWSEIPPLSLQKLKELIDPELMDYLAKEVPIEELQKTLMKAQKSVKEQVEQKKKEIQVIRL